VEYIILVRARGRPKMVAYKREVGGEDLEIGAGIV